MRLRSHIAVDLAVAGVTLWAGLAGAAGEGGHAQGGHDLREAPFGAPAPRVTLEAHPDVTDGYNLHLVVENFRFSPENTGKETDGVEGHAHLYVNGVKIGRVYGPWAHLPASRLAAGENEVRVSLNGNRHRAWALDGVPVEDALTLVAIEGAGPQEIVLRLDAEASGEPQVVELAQGGQARIEVHGAPSGALHLHGYDLAAHASEGQPAVLAFEAKHAGRFPVMAHVHDAVLGEQEKALFYIDIR